MRMLERSTRVLRCESLARQVLAENPILVDKIMAALNSQGEDVVTALREVIRFLHLVSKYDQGRLTPSHRVDLAWHEFILCTLAYQQFCDRQFGRMVHHFPGGSQTENRRQFDETLRCYQRLFGVPDVQYWGRTNAVSPACGACESV